MKFFFLSFQTEVKYKVLTPKRIPWNCHFPILEMLRQHSNFWYPEPAHWCRTRGEAEQPSACCLGMFSYRRATARENSLSLTSSTDDLTSPLVASCWHLLVRGSPLQVGSRTWRAKHLTREKKAVWEIIISYSTNKRKKGTGTRKKIWNKRFRNLQTIPMSKYKMSYKMLNSS